VVEFFYGVACFCYVGAVEPIIEYFSWLSLAGVATDEIIIKYLQGVTLTSVPTDIVMVEYLCWIPVAGITTDIVIVEYFYGVACFCYIATVEPIVKNLSGLSL